MFIEGEARQVKLPAVKYLHSEKSTVRYMIDAYSFTVDFPLFTFFDGDWGQRGEDYAWLEDFPFNFTRIKRKACA